MVKAQEKRQEKDMFDAVHCKTKRSGFLLTEILTALALLGMIIVFVAHFERHASATAGLLEKEYVATVAGESQFERLRAGLDVLDPETFRQRYRGLELDYRVRRSEQTGEQVGVVTITAKGPKDRVFVRLVGPIPQSLPKFGAGQP